MTSLIQIRKQAVKDGVAAIIEVTGQPIVLEVITRYDSCPTCSGTDPFCPTCHGNEVVPVIESIPYTAKVNWKNSGQKVFMKGWQETEGDCVVGIPINDDLYSQLERTKRIYVNRVWCTLINFFYGGFDNNRIYVTLAEDVRDQPRTG